MKNLILRYMALALWLLCCAIVTVPASAADAPKSKQKVNTIELLSLFGNVFDTVHRSYVTEVEDKAMIEAAINGMLTSLDPHSAYLNEKEYEEMRAQNKGEFGGLGLELTHENGLVKVITPLDGAPAAIVGMQAGDYIFSINEEPIFGMTLSEATEKLRGKPGTKVVLTVLRDGQSEPLTFTITREIIKDRTARSKLFDDVAYIRLRSFVATTTDSLETEFLKCQKEAKKPLKGLVLDLRNNPGGLLDQAISVADAFLDGGEIVSTRGRDASDNSRALARKGDITKGLPIVVLINNGSASASEIVAGALQDHKRGIVLGIRSFGKGSVQKLIPLQNHGAIKLTTARYYTPSGHSIQAEGIKPDILVEVAKIEFSENKEHRRINEASLHKHLLKEKPSLDASGKPGSSQSGSSKSAPSKSAPAIPAPSAETHAPAANPAATGKTTTDDSAIYASDFQLARAIDLLRGLSLVNTQKSPPLPRP